MRQSGFRRVVTRPRPLRFPFSALRFLESALRQRRFFARLRDVLILSLRTLLLIALAAGFARPLLRGLGGEAAEGVGRRVVVLDASRSMNARKGGVRVFDRARAQALRYVARREGLRINLLLAGATPRAAFDTFSINYPALQAEVRRAEVRDEKLDARAALARAAQMLHDSAATGKDQVVPPVAVDVGTDKRLRYQKTVIDFYSFLRLPVQRRRPAARGGAGFLQYYRKRPN